MSRQGNGTGTNGVPERAHGTAWPQTSPMAATAPRKLRRRTLDHLRQKLWAVPAHLRLRVSRRGAPPAKTGPHRSTAIR
jgi:hypothetical protein